MSDHDTYVTKLEAQVSEWSAGMDRLKAKADGMTAEVRDTVQKQLAEGKMKLAVAREKLGALKAVGSDQWEATKANVERFWKHATTVFEKVDSSSAK